MNRPQTAAQGQGAPAPEAHAPAAPAGRAGYADAALVTADAALAAAGVALGERAERVSREQFLTIATCLTSLAA